MGGATFLIGLLPSYATAGISAAVILSLLRILQGVALGGEWGGASLMVNEIDPQGHRRGFYGSMVQVASPVGYLLAYGIFALVTFLVTGDRFLDWGWRIPFLASGALILIGYYIRRSIAESPLFEEIERRRATAQAPIAEVIQVHWRKVLIAIGSRIGSDIVFSIENDDSHVDRPRAIVRRRVEIFDARWLEGHPDLTVEEYGAFMHMVQEYGERIASGEVVKWEVYAARPYGYAETVAYIKESAAHLRGVCAEAGIALK